MLEYLAAAIAFAIMVHWRYIREVLQVVQDLRVALDIEDEETNWSPVLFSALFFIVSTVTMPIVAIYIFTSDRIKVIKDMSGAIIKSYFQLEEK